MQPWNYEAEPRRIALHRAAAGRDGSRGGVRRAALRGLCAGMLPCALVVMLLIFNDTVLRPGRWPYIVDWSAYARAVAIRDGEPRRTACRGATKGVWAVAAANPRVRLDPHPDPHFVACPAYNTNARGVFRKPRRDTCRTAFCGGVPVAAR